MSTTDHDNGNWILSIDRIEMMNRLGELGIDGVEQRLTQLGADDVTVRSEQVKSGYVGVGTMEAEFDHDRVGAQIALPNVPYGHILVLFPRASANNAAALMLSEATDDLDSVDREMAEDALTELSGIMASGFLDAWADAFDVRIDVGTPNTVTSRASDLVTRLVDEGDDLGLYIASKFAVPAYDIDAEVYLLPENESFIEVLHRVDPGMVA